MDRAAPAGCAVLGRRPPLDLLGEPPGAQEQDGGQGEGRDDEDREHLVELPVLVGARKLVDEIEGVDVDQEGLHRHGEDDDDEVGPSPLGQSPADPPFGE